MQLIILFGGASFEHEISIVSAITLKEKLDSLDLAFIFCDSDHSFYKIDADNMKAKFFSSGDYKKSPILSLVQGGFYHKKRFSKEHIRGCVLNLIHGSDGEDGTMAALFDFYAIDYIGPRVAASVFSFDKRYTKYFADARSIKRIEHEELHVDDVRHLKTPYPCIVKPARLGSSIGVSVVNDESELDYALDVAFEFDDVVVIEPFIAGVKEYNLAGAMVDGVIRFSIVEEPQKKAFLDFEKKYLDFSRSAKVQEADIDDALKSKLHSAFTKIYSDMFEGALIRCDFFVINNEVYLNEINPIPGSMANYLFEGYASLITGLMQSTPKKSHIRVNYDYIHQISAAKGK